MKELYKKANWPADKINQAFDQKDLQKELAGGELYIRLTGVELYTKLAQALLSMGERVRAQEVLELVARKATAMALNTPAADVLDTSKSSKAPKVELPGKWIISAPKKLLDQVGSGKISFEEFRKQVTVETYSLEKGEKGTK